MIRLTKRTMNDIIKIKYYTFDFFFVRNFQEGGIPWQMTDTY